MKLTAQTCSQHAALTRRYFLQLGSAGAIALGALPAWSRFTSADDATEDPELAEAIAKLNYLTKDEDFGTIERGNPLPYTLDEDKRREIGLERETWTLEVLADPASDSVLESPLTKEAGTALTFEALRKLGERHAVRFLKVMTCNNMNAPLGMGLWEGVPLREVLWLARPVENVRRVFYHGHHNEDAAQLFQSSLSVGRVLEDPPGDHPVVLCYKLNGQWLSGKRGGPVRMLVPEAYGFKSVKWLKRVLVTNNHQANDTYADGNNDIESWMKSFARFVGVPSKVKAGERFPMTGLAQVGVSGLSRVQWWVQPRDKALDADDPYFAKGDWHDAKVLSPPTEWGGELGEGELPHDVRCFDEDRRPEHWPQRYTIAHWAALAPGLPGGKYDLRCRTIDDKGVAQPLPRPFVKSGRNSIQELPLTVEG